MAEPQQVLYRNVTTGQLGYVDADKAKTFDGDPDYRRADNTELVQARERVQAESITGRAETLGRGIAQGVGSTAQAAAKLTGGTAGKILLGMNPISAVPYWANQLTQGAVKDTTGVDAQDLSRSLPSQVAGVVGGDEVSYAERDRTLGEINPGTMTTGQIIGEAALTLPSGGLAGSLTAGKGLAARTAAQIIQGGAEGALLGTGGAIRDAQRLGTGATDEELLAGGLMGAALGGGIAGGLTGLGGAAKAVKTKMGSSLSDLMASRSVAAESGLAGEIAADGTETILGRVKRAISTDAQGAPTGNVSRAMEDIQVSSGVPRDALREFGALNRSDEARAARDLVRDQVKIHEAAVGDVTRAVGDVEDGLEVVRKIWGDKEARARIAAPEIPDQLAAKRAAVQQIAETEASIKAAADRVRSENAEFMSNQDVNMLIKTLNKSQNNIAYLVKNGADLDASQWFAEVNRIKQGIQRDTMAINPTKFNGAANTAAKDVRKTLLEASDKQLVPFLEREDIWGKAGAAQREINAPYKLTLDDDGAFRDQFLRDNWRKDFADGAVRHWVDPAKVDTALKRIGRFETDPLLEMVSGRVEGATKLLEAFRAHIDLPPAQLKQVEDAIAANQNLKQQLGDTLSRVGKINKFSALEEVEKRNASSMGILPGMGGIGGGAMVGGLVGGPVGALLGAGLATTAGMIARPASFALASDHIADVAARAIGTKWLSAAKSLVEGPATSAAGKVSQAASRVASGASGVTTVARKAATPIALEAFRGGEKDLQKAYEKRADTIIAAAQQSPVDAMDQLRKSAPALDDAPEIAAAVLERQQRAIGFLAANMPGALWVKNPLNPTARPRPANEEIINYAKGWEAVVNPSTVIRDLARGVAVPIQMEALRTVYPGMLEALQRKTWQEVQKMDAAKKPIPLYRRQRLDMLLDLNGAGIPALSQVSADKIIAMRSAADAQQAKPQQSKPPQLSAAMASTQTNWPSARGA